jgi:phage-related protein
VVSRTIEVRHGQQTPEWKYYNTDPGGGFCKTIKISFECEFPYWEDTAFTDDSNVMAGDGAFATDCTGSDDIVLPIITITATADCPSIKITNLDDGGMYFEYNNPQFVAGSVLIIDSAMGTITLNGNDARSYIMPGSAFLRLQPMNNNFYYLGAACTIVVSLKKVYA